MSEHPREQLQRYPDLLDDHERVELQNHLFDCPECQAFYARIEAIRDGAGELGDARFQVQPSPELDGRVLDRLRTEAERVGGAGKPRRWFVWIGAPGLAAAAAALVLLLHPASPLRGPDPDPGRDPGLGPDWQPKGDDDDGGPMPELQLALVQGESTRPLRSGDAVPPDAEILLGGAVPVGVNARVYLVMSGGRQAVWTGIGDAASAGGGALLTEGVPTVIRAPGTGEFAIEIVRMAPGGGEETAVEKVELGVKEVP